jgi:hypothetical protein
MKHIKLFEEFLIETTSGDILNPRRNVPLQFDPVKHKELAGEMFNLIQTAYSELGGHVKIRKPEDIFSDPDWNYWEGIDIHGDDNFDLIMWGQKTRYGVKYSGVGHDGSKEAKKTYLEEKGKELKMNGFYAEVSGKIAEIFINKYNCPVVHNQADVERVLGKKVDWNGNIEGFPGDGWYARQIGGHSHSKIMLGHPKIK